MVESKVDVAEVLLWGRNIAAVAWDEQRQVANFQYTQEFIQSGIQVAPLTMPLSSSIYSFNSVAKETFFGLPGLLADALPDKFGNALIDAWLAKKGRDKSSFSPIERLCYMGDRGMGALEFRPTLDSLKSQSTQVDIEQLVTLANDVLSERVSLATSFKENSANRESMTHASEFSEVKKQKALEDIIKVGTSAGGARAKAVIAWNRTTQDIRSGQVTAPPGFSYWILKFDGVSNNKDKELADPQGFGKVEYAYYMMATAAGIQMMESHLLEENQRYHFVTKRFDRFESGDKLHLQSLCAIDHLDFNMAGAHSYEQAFQVMEKLSLTMDEKIEQFRRMVFNVIARNQDDHTKNIAYLMNKKGEWRLSPAYDICFAYNPDGAWTNQHQMSINGKRDDFVDSDFLIIAKAFNIKRSVAVHVIEEVKDSVLHWQTFAQKAGVDSKFSAWIEGYHRI